MKISTTFEIIDENNNEKMEALSLALQPDNLPNMSTEITEGKMKIQIESEKITSLIAVMDDLLMNARIAEELLDSNSNEENKT
ncbi:KEOPS complex subunit Pcc1 [Methanohalophilus levihalophilus]|uniref:KEOPS complex subunit Pcc1 n=1 Tax=Methanohalophilus levihalophilus TaxID=1431282 RepID=UPI001AE6457D|nr:KEOPS complex subunit Pcc1 [Methanohalophilus levihalophilus]